MMPAQDTQYTATDLDLRSSSTIETLIAELDQHCAVVCTHGDDGRWYATIESTLFGELDAATEISAILAALGKLSEVAKAEFNNCDKRDFNIGFDCWDSWSYNHMLPNEVVRGIAEAGCTLSVTLYPMRNADGTPKVSFDGTPKDG